MPNSRTAVTSNSLVLKVLAQASSVCSLVYFNYLNFLEPDIWSQKVPDNRGHGDEMKGTKFTPQICR